MDYVTLKAIHLTAVALSIAGFIARGWGGLLGAGWVRRGQARTWPHVIDTALLASGLLLAWSLRLTPGAAPWLMAKLGGLLLYILLGRLALRPGRPLRVRVLAWAGALATVGWMVSVAISKQPLGFLAPLWAH